MIEINLLRHVKVDGPAALYGSTDIAPQLVENNKLLIALDNTQRSAPYDLVISSSLQRCQTLAKKFSQQHDIPFICLDNLQEMNFGDYDGVSFDDINQSPKYHWQLLEAFWQSPSNESLPNAETLTQFHQRVIASWTTLVSQQLNELHCDNKPRRVLLVTHGGVICMILAHILQLNWQSASWQQHLQIANGSCSKITISQPYKDKNNTHSVVNYIGLSMIS
jgi:alpha-ribazole phosphatase/probable phosphoglycerate mutase